MFKTLGPVIGLSVLSACSAGDPGRVSSSDTRVSQDRQISVSGSADVKVPPDEVVISLGVETWNSRLDSAKAQNDEAVRRILAIGPRFGIKATDIQTDFISVEPTIYESSDDHVRRITGYKVQKSIVISLKDVRKFEDVLTAALDSGANYVHGVDFRTTDLRKHRDVARAMATKAAKEKAEALAKELGTSVRRVINIREDSFGWRYPYGRNWGSPGGGMSQNVVQSAGPPILR